MTVQGLGTVIYHVADLDRAKAWYATAFGQQPYLDEPFYVGFNIAGYELGLNPDHTRGQARPWRLGRVLARRRHRSRRGTLSNRGRGPASADPGRRRRHPRRRGGRPVRQPDRLDPESAVSAAPNVTNVVTNAVTRGTDIMDEKSLFTEFWIKESKTTRNVLARIPDGSDYRPDPKSRTAQEIAWQIVCEEKMIIDALESGKAAWAPPPLPAAMKEVLEAYEQPERRDGRALAGIAGRAVDGELEFFGSSASGVADGVELPLRHRPPPRPDYDLPAADGVEGAADLRAERRRTVDITHKKKKKKKKKAGDVSAVSARLRSCGRR